MIINEIEVNSLVTKTQVPAADYVINPYIGCPHKCIYCYAEFMKRFTHHHEDWGNFLDVKRCTRKLNAKKYAGSRVVLSTVTDAYNPFEKKYGITREILKAFIDSDAQLSILTKSDLVLRDLDILRRLRHAEVGISLNAVDDEWRKQTESGASALAKRVDVLRVLKEEGIPCHVFVSPIFPGITDFKAIIETCAPYTNEFHFENLNLRGAFRARVLDFISRYNSALLPLYEGIYKYKDKSFWENQEKEILDFCKKRKLKCISYFYHEKIKKPR